MPDLVLWLLLALAAVLSAMVLSAVMEVLFGREPAEPAPLAFDPIVLPPADDITRVLPVRFVGRAAVVDTWSTLAEFARPVPTAPALIGSDVEALFTLRRAAVAS